MEFTTPLLALRWFLSEAGLKSHPLYAVNGLLVVVGWWVFRIGLFVGFFGYKLARMAASGNVIPRDYPIVASWLIGVVLQVTWAEKITTGFVKVVKEMLKGEGGDSSKAKKGE